MKEKVIAPILLIALILVFALHSHTMAQTDGFSLFILPSALEVRPSGSYRATVFLFGEETADVRLNVASVPRGLTVRFMPQSLSVPGVSVLEILASPDFVPGEYSLEISASGGSHIQFAVLSLRQKKILEIGISTRQCCSWPGEKVTLDLFAYHLNPQPNLVLSIPDLPVGLECSFSPMHFLGPGTSTSSFTLSPALSFKPGLYQLTVSAIEGKHSSQANLDFAVLFFDTREHWAKESIASLLLRGVLAGYPDGGFRPDASLTRAEFAKIISLGFDLPSRQGGAKSFTDLEPNFWAAPYIERAWKAGVVEGFPDGSFRPNDPVKRAEIAAMLCRVFSWPLIPQNTAPTFIDLDSAHWAFVYIETGAWQGAWDGYPDGDFRPEAPATRGEIASLIAPLVTKPAN